MPLDYSTRRPPDEDELADARRRATASPGSPDRAREAFGGRGDLVAVPAEFDALLDVAADVATTAAIEAALRRASVGVIRGRDASARGGAIDLHVRVADLDRARAVARGVIDRRVRLRD